jgi:hypothetical protein
LHNASDNSDGPPAKPAKTSSSHTHPKKRFAFGSKAPSTETTCSTPTFSGRVSRRIAPPRDAFTLSKSSFLPSKPTEDSPEDEKGQGFGQGRMQYAPTMRRKRMCRFCNASLLSTKIFCFSPFQMHTITLYSVAP